jgi:thiazole synthase ThiGH ThiG subunit
MNQEQLSRQLDIAKKEIPVLVDSGVKTASAIAGIGCHYLGLLLNKAAQAANQIERKVTK